MIHDSFPQETVSDFLTRVTNKNKIGFSSLYLFKNNIHNESKKLAEPRKKCKQLKLEIVKY